MANHSQQNPGPTASAISYRDPSGFVFQKDGIIYRQVNQVFRKHFDYFIKSGCYEHLVKTGLLLPHEIIDENCSGEANWHTTLKPERIPFVSYPYEWSFDMLKEAALLTLRIMEEVLAFGIILKDATPYNIQWYKGKLIFIDTLSFEKYDEQQPWIAYRQFCECFLGPLLLMHHRQQSLHTLWLAWPDGIPLATVRALLPWKTKLSLHTYLHIHLHAALSQKKNLQPGRKIIFSRKKLKNLIDSLNGLVRKTRLPEFNSTWSGYYDEASTRDDYLQQKKKLAIHWLQDLPAIHTAVDIGSNEGEFSFLLAGRNINVLATDFDAYCINRLYRKIRSTATVNIQPLILDIANPSPASGLNNEERVSFLQRVNTDLVIALAVVHHLAIGRNIPFELIAKLCRQMGQHLLIEFVPKSDEKVQLMLSVKKDIYTQYSEPEFETAFKTCFSILKKEKIPGSERILYLMQRL